MFCAFWLWCKLGSHYNWRTSREWGNRENIKSSILCSLKDLYRNSNVWLNAKRLTLQGGTMCEERCCTPSGRVSAYGSYYVRANPSCRFHSCQENGWFSVWGKFKHLVIQRGTSDAEKHTKQEKNDVWQQIPGNASYPWPCLVRQSSRSKTGSSLLLQQLLVAHICEQHDGLKKQKNTCHCINTNA